MEHPHQTPTPGHQTLRDRPAAWLSLAARIGMLVFVIMPLLAMALAWNQPTSAAVQLKRGTPTSAEDSPVPSFTLTASPTLSSGEATSTPTLPAMTPVITATPPAPAVPSPTATFPITVTATATLTATLSVTPTALLPELKLAIAAAPTAGLPPPGPTLVPSSSDPHVNYLTTTDSCAACHRAHSANGLVLRQTSPEEAVCFACHSPGGTGTDVQGAFTSYTNTATRIFKHDIAQANALHQPGESSAARFGGANRHVECEDCHDPHEATRGSASPPTIQREMYAMSGVDPQWPLDVPGAPAGYTWLAQAGREYQVCLKCHSAFTSLPSYRPDGWNGTAYVSDGLWKLDRSTTIQLADSRNLAQEFNSNNASYHPVAAVGRNQSIPPGSFVNGWTQGSLTYCSDCHDNASSSTQGDGPHGSPRLHILAGTANYTTVDNTAIPASGEICFLCHSYAVYVTLDSSTETNFRNQNKNLHKLHSGKRTACYTCHDTHGSEQLHLINFNANVATIPAGRDSQTAWYATSTGGGCYLACHGTQHDPKTYSR